MSWERAGRLAWIAPALTAALGAGYHAILPAADRQWLDVLFDLTWVAYAAIGALIVSRHPRHPVGWLFCGVGVVIASQGLFYAYGRRPDEPGATVAAWVDAWSGEPSTVAIVLLLLLFPTGRFASRRWRLAGLWALGTALVWALALALDPGRLRNSETLDNPVGIEAAAPVLGAIADFGVAFLLLFILVGVAGAIARFRRARGEERQQNKWLALAAGVMLAMLLSVVALIGAVDTDEGVWDVVTALLICSGLASFPVAAGMAILRRRLYDIDLVIRRTLVYGALTATLGGAYLAIVVLTGLAVGESDLAVAASTLAVAALFRPARARIQEIVDRRFYRRRYDATLTLAAFSARLRDELDLDALGTDLRGVVRDSVQPAHVSLWLREGSR